MQTIVYYTSVRVEIPAESVQQPNRTHPENNTQNMPSSIDSFFFHFFSVSSAVTHPSTDTYFHNSGWASHFLFIYFFFFFFFLHTPLPVAAHSRSVRFRFIFPPLKLHLLPSVSACHGVGRRKESTPRVFFSSFFRQTHRKSSLKMTMRKQTGGRDQSWLFYGYVMCFFLFLQLQNVRASSPSPCLKLVFSKCLPPVWTEQWNSPPPLLASRQPLIH